MSSEVRTYLEWRFRMNNHAKYLKYMNEWIDGIPDSELWYFTIEMNHLISRGIYH